jgi:hypothetical protein
MLRSFKGETDRKSSVREKEKEQSIGGITKVVASLLVKKFTPMVPHSTN